MQINYAGFATEGIDSDTKKIPLEMQKRGFFYSTAAAQMRQHCNKIAQEERKKTEPHRTSARKRARKRFDHGTTDKNKAKVKKTGFLYTGSRDTDRPSMRSYRRLRCG
jgi:hypothetical protein